MCAPSPFIYNILFSSTFPQYKSMLICGHVWSLSDVYRWYLGEVVV